MIIILILLLILLYLSLNHNEKFIVNPKIFFTGVTPMKTLRNLRRCNPNNVSCV